MKDKKSRETDIIVFIILSSVFFFFSLGFSSGNGNVSERIIGYRLALSRVMKLDGVIVTPLNFIYSFLLSFIFLFSYKEKTKKKKKYKPGEEYGSARWGTKDDIAPFVDPLPENNVILTSTEYLTMNPRPENPKYARNKNVLVIGGSGSGKTRFWLKPNIMQNMVSSSGFDARYSLAICDSKGSVIRECGKMLEKEGYTIKIFNTVNFKKSMHYNPFKYIKGEKDIIKLVTSLIANTSGEGKASDPFWEKSEVLLYSALIGYIWSEAVEEEQNFGTLLEFLNSMETREHSDTFKNPVDRIFEDLELIDPANFAVRQYKKFKLAAAKTAKSILINAAARLAPFDIEEVREIVSYDELELDTLGDCGEDGKRRVALFLIMSDTDPTFNFLLSLIYTQLFNSLCEKADDRYGGRLPVHVRCLVDEAANIGLIPNLEKLVATMRSREISIGLIYQTQSQIKSIYKENAETIIGNMDSILFLGGSEQTTLKELSEALGKETIDLGNEGENRGRESSKSMSYQKLGRELCSIDELSVLDGSKCILRLRGVRPFLSDKFDITTHKKYKELSDYDKRNEFDIEEFLSTELEIKENDSFETYKLS